MTNLNKDQLQKLFHLASLNMPEEVYEGNISKALIEIEKKISPHVNIKSEIEPGKAPSVLVIDDLELTIYQLSLMLVKSGFNTSVARSSIEAADLFKKRHYDYVLLDLFLPDSQDGLKLLSEFSSIGKNSEDAPKVIVISGTDDKKLIKECFLKGANEFIEKNENWHTDILKHINHLEKQKKSGNQEILATIEDETNKIVTLSIINLHKDSVNLELTKEVKSLVNSGYKNIIIDLENLYNINSKGIGSLISAYKSVKENDGTLVLCNIKNSVNEVLTYVFLHNVLKIFSTKKDAINSFKK